ncbi:MAG: hypothetical protein V4556_05545 [Bacteroidota bacterium]
MKSIKYLSFLFTLAIILSACPYSSPYTLDTEPQQAINESYLGKWATMATKIINDKKSVVEPVKIILSKKDDMTYEVALIGYINEFRKYRIVTDDTIKGSAFLSTAVNKEFLNINIAGRYYLAEVKNEDGIFSIYPLSDYFTNKLIRSSASLRNSLEFHYKTRLTPSYDEEFILKDLKRVN